MRLDPYSGHPSSISAVERFDDNEIDRAIWNGVLDYCRLDNDGVFLNQDSAAKDVHFPDVWLVPEGGAAIDDAIYFGSDNPFRMMSVVMGATVNTDNAYAWEYYNGAAWAAMGGLVDGTLVGGFQFGQSGDVAWTSISSLVTIDGQEAYWMRARITAAGADVPLAATIQRGPAVEAGATLIAEIVPEGELKISNAGGVAAGLSYLPAKFKWGNYSITEVQIKVVDGEVGGDGERCEASVHLFKDTDNYIKWGVYRDTSEAVNSSGYLRYNIDGAGEVAVNVTGIVVDNAYHTLKLAKYESAVEIYYDDDYRTGFAFPGLVNYTLRLEAGTQDAGDRIDIRFDNLKMLNVIDPFDENVTADLTTLLTRLSAARAGYLDNLNIGGVVASGANLVTHDTNLINLIAAHEANLVTHEANLVTHDTNLANLIAAHEANLVTHEANLVTHNTNLVNLIAAHEANLVTHDTNLINHEIAEAIDRTALTNHNTTMTTRLSGVRAGYLDYLADGTYGLAAIETLVDDLETRLSAVRAGYLDYLADGTYGLPAIETLVDDLETRLSAVRAGYLDNLNIGDLAANDTDMTTALADLTTLLARLSAIRAGYIDNLNVGGLVANDADMTTALADLTTALADLTTLLVRLSAIRAGYIDNLNVGGLVANDADMVILLARLSAVRAGYIDNLNIGGLVANDADLTAHEASQLVHRNAMTTHDTTMTTRLSAVRAGYLDNLAGHDVAATGSGTLTINDALVHTLEFTTAVYGAIFELTFIANLDFPVTGFVDRSNATTVMVVKVFEKYSGVYSDLCDDRYQWQKETCDRNVRINSWRAITDMKLSFQLDIAPPAAISIPYHYQILRLKA